MNNILITGGAGYIGSLLSSSLLQEWHIVKIVDKFMYNNQHTITPLLRYHNCRVMKADVLDLKRTDINGYDTIVHLAAVVGAGACDKNLEEAEKSNITATEHLCDIVSPRHHIIYANTNSGYGVGGEDLCTEESPMNPISFYGKSKLEGEKIILERHKKSTVFRLATVFGLSPRMRYDLMVNDFVRKLYFNDEISIFEPHFRRNFVHINDVVRAIKMAITYPDEVRGVFNLGDDSANCTKLQLAEQIVKILNKPAQPRIILCDGEDIDKRDYIVSSQKLYKAGFSIANSLTSGIVQLKKHYSCYEGDVRYVDMQNSV